MIFTETFSKNSSWVKISIVEDGDQKECWIHDLEGEGMDAVELMAKARQQAKDWGFKEVWANVHNPKLAAILRDHGWSLEQLIFKGAL